MSRLVSNFAVLVFTVLVVIGSGTVTHAAEATASAPSPAAVGEADRPIAPQDLLFIAIVGEASIPTEFRVSASGEVQFPFIGSIEAQGLTPTAFRDRLKEALSKDYFVAPEVIVTVKDYRQEFVHVIGEVNRPGQIPLPPERKIDIMDAIAFANGITRLAKNKVSYTHKGVTKEISLEELKRVTDPSKRIWLEPGDIIEVKQSAF